MKRDMELVRDLLLVIENNGDRRELDIPKEWDRELVAYHLKILEQAGYVKNNTKWADNKPMWIMASLTWDGHEFIDSIKSDNVWEKTKDGVKKKGLELSNIPLDVLKEFASIQIKSILGF